MNERQDITNWNGDYWKSWREHLAKIAGSDSFLNDMAQFDLAMSFRDAVERENEFESSQAAIQQDQQQRVAYRDAQWHKWADWADRADEAEAFEAGQQAKPTTPELC